MLTLIGGTGRSGTSFVYRQILRNEEAAGIPDFESEIFTAPISLVDLFDRYVTAYSPDRFRFACSVFSKTLERKFLDLPDSRSDSHIDKEVCQKSIKAFFESLYRDRLSNVPNKVCFQNNAAGLVSALLGFNPAVHKTILEKTPHNILVFEKIIQIFPNAKLLHIVRDPRAVAESVVRQSWGPDDYQSAVIWVRLILDAWIAAFERPNFPKGNVLVIRMEDLVEKYQDIEAEVREFLSHRLNCLSLQANASSLNGWSDSISRQDLIFANEKLEKIMDYFGYAHDVLEV